MTSDDMPSGEASPRLSRLDLAAIVVTSYSFAVSVPLIDLLRQNVAFFVARDSPRLDYFLFALIITIVVPGVLVGALMLVPGSQTRDWIQGGIVCLLLSLVAFQLLKRLTTLVNPPLVLDIAAALTFGGLGVAATWRFQWVRQFCRYTAVLPIVIAAFFLISPSVRVATATASPSSPSNEAVSEASVVMVVFDELPIISLMDTEGRINTDRFPNFARLANMTTWFRDASTSAPSTIEAVPSLLTGQYPKGWNVALPVLSAHPRNVFTMGAFEEVVASEQVTQLCPVDQCARRVASAGERLTTMASDLAYVTLHIILPSELTEHLPPIDENWGYFGVSEVGNEPEDRETVQEEIREHLRGDRTASFNAFVEQVRPRSSSTLYFHHTMLTHRPWVYLPSGASYIQNPRVPGIATGSWLDQEWLADQGLQRHLLQAGYADRLLGQLLDKLIEGGMTEDTILVITADHGISFEAGLPLRQADSRTLGMVLGVPLFVSIPGAEGTVVDAPVELVDVLPTTADLIGADLSSWDLDGQSLLDSRESQTRRALIGDELREIDALAEDRDRILEMIDRRVPMNRGWEAIFEAGVRPHLIGLEVDAVQIGAHTRWVARVENLEAHQSQQIDEQIWPIMVTGYLEDASVDVAVDLAIVVNGRISTVTRTFDQRRASMFSAMTRIDDMRRDQRDLAVYLVDDLDGIEVFRPVEIAPAEQ